MTAYYPSQGGYHGHVQSQPTMYAPSAPAGYVQQQQHGYPMSMSYAQPSVMAAPQMMPTMVAQPVAMQPGYAPYPVAYGHGYPQHNPYGWGARFRRWFGLAPPANPNVHYKHSHSSWGFMGYSRRPRYVDARTGGEVDRLGRPVYRV